MSALEDKYFDAFKFYAKGYPMPEREYRWMPSRKYRGDFVWLNEKVIVEIQGGGAVRGAHHSLKGYSSDCTRQAEAILQGYLMIYFDTLLMKNPKRCVEVTKKVLDMRMK